MDDAPAATTEDVAQGRVALCTPGPTGRKRRRATDPVGEEPRPWWAPERDMGGRLDAMAVAQKIVCTVYQNLNEWIGGRWPVEAGESPIRRGEDLFAADRRSPTRMIAAELFGLSPAKVAEYWKEMQANQGAPTAAKARGAQRKHGPSNQRGCAARGDAVRRHKKRIREVRAMGKVGAAINPLRRAKDGPGGPQSPESQACISGRYYFGPDLDTRSGGRLAWLRAGCRTSPDGALPIASDSLGELPAMMSLGISYS